MCGEWWVGRGLSFSSLSLPPGNDFAGRILLQIADSLVQAELDKSLHLTLGQLAIGILAGADNKGRRAPVTVNGHLLDRLDIHTEGMDFNLIELELTKHPLLQHPELVLGEGVSLGDDGDEVDTLVNHLHVDDVDGLEFKEDKVEGTGGERVCMGACD